MIGELLPDQPALDNPGVLRAENVIPYAEGYRPVFDMVSNTNALISDCRGAALLLDATGAIYNYAGDETDIYTRQGSTYTSVTTGYSLGSKDRWEFDRYYDTVIAVTPTEKVQTGAFGAAMTDADANAPQAKHVATVGNFVIVGSITNSSIPAISTDAAAVEWSALGNPDNWTDGEHGGQHLDGAGQVTGLFGGEYLTIMMQGGIYRGQPIGPPAQWQFSLVIPNRPCPYSGAQKQVGRAVYFLSYDGFYVFNGNSVLPISSGKLSQSFFADFDRDSAHLMTTEADLENNLIYFSYPGSGHSGVANKMMVFNYVSGLWTGPIQEDVQQLLFSQTPGTLSDDTDFDVRFGQPGPPYISDTDPMGSMSVDDPGFLGGNDPVLGAFIPGNTHAVPIGETKIALIESGEFQHNPGGYAMVTGFRPYVDGTAPLVSGRIRYRNKTSDAVSEFPLALINDRTGKVDQRISARYHRYEIRVAGGFTSLHGGEPEVKRVAQR